MKNIVITLFTLVSLVSLFSCSNEIYDRSENYPTLTPVANDDLAGTWRPILLSAPDEFSLDAPVATSNAAFTREINEIKSYQEAITDEQKAIIKYWSAGSVLRWNEIMRTLVTKHNLPPYQNADGTYPTPSAANPFASTPFPFSNPPYAARAYAYVSAAQYDALVATWHYKKLYN
ncbi:MAG: hypothetical protein RL311_464, partial [Bacteroidota bacterium]